LGVTGNDQAADELAKHLVQAGIDTFIQRQPDVATIIKLRVMRQTSAVITFGF